MTKKFWINQNLKSKLIKIIWIILVLLVMIIWITIAKNQSGINPHSKKIAELSFELNELETHKRICLDNLSYKESIDNEKGIHSHCVAYDERMMAVSEEIERLKSWDWDEEEEEEEVNELNNGIWEMSDMSIPEEREPGQLNEEWTAQVMPNVEWNTEHERFKDLASKYDLDASVFWNVENHYWIKEWVILCITVAETSWGKRWYWAKNIGSVGSNDRWDRPTYALMEAWLEAIGKTLTNKYLGSKKTLWCLSNAGSCKEANDNAKRYATSNGNWERNMVWCLSQIYWPIDPSTFNIRR